MERDTSCARSVAGFLMASALATTISGSAAAQSLAPKIFNRSPASTVQRYWDPARMAAAKPMGIVAAGVARHTVAPLATGQPGAAGGSVPGGSLIKGMQSPSRPTTAPIPADGLFPGPHTTFEYLPKYLKYPVSTIGKLFFTIPGSGDFVCSASVTTGSASINNIIWTAGHCVANGGAATFYTNWLFCPSYDSSQGGANPAVGCWSWSFATTSSEWFNSGTFARDYAIIGLQSSGTVKNADVATVTGSLGFAWNFGRDQAWVHLGYPAASPFTGGKIIWTSTEHRYDDIAQGSPPTNSWGTSQTPGSSGSAVVLSFNYVTPPFINSDVSYFYTSGPNGNEAGKEIQGPYFDTQVCTFWKNNTGFSGSC